jgi:hypothetical protein
MRILAIASLILISHNALARDVAVTADLERVEVNSIEQSEENIKIILDAGRLILNERAAQLCGTLAEPLAAAVLVSADIRRYAFGRSAIFLGYFATAKVTGNFRCMMPADGVLTAQSSKEFIYESADERRLGFASAIRELQEDALAQVALTCGQTTQLVEPWEQESSSFTRLAPGHSIRECVYREQLGNPCPKVYGAKILVRARTQC